MKPILQFFSRISVRLLAFNVLLVFLPLTGVFFLGEYEGRLEDSLDRSLVAQAEVLAASLSGRGPLYAAEVQSVLDRLGPARQARMRVIGADRVVIADSWRAGKPSETMFTTARANWLYRVAAAIIHIPRTMFGDSELLLQPADYYEASGRLQGPEILAGFRGEPGKQERTTAGGERSITLYRTVPVRNGADVVGVVLATQTTQRLLKDLYVVRLGIMRIIVISIVVASVLSLWIAATIVRPISKLRREAGEIVDRSGRLRGRFSGSDRLDEIGDLSRALETLTRAVERHLQFIESFSADVSHEFKNPLASIRTATEMLSEVEEPEERERFLEIVQEEIARMESLLSGIREVTQIDAELPGETRQHVAVGQVLAQIVDGFRLREGTRVSIRFERADPDPVVRVATERLTQVFVNLLDNAVSFSPDGGVIDVIVRPETTSVCVAVNDQGPGVPPSHLDRIFDRFFSYRPDSGSSADRHVGLGLSIVKTIVDGYGGSISVRNLETRGASFEVRLPATGIAAK